MGNSGLPGPTPAKSLMAFFGIGYYSNMVYEKTDWSYKSFAMDGGMKAAKRKRPGALDAVNPDLSALPLSRRQADSVSRLERSSDSGDEHHQLLRRGDRKNGADE